MAEDFPTTTSVNEDQSSVVDFILMFAIFGFAGFGVYLSFLVFGALAGSFTSNVPMRAGSGLVMAFLLPLIVSLSSLGHEQDKIAMRLSKLAMSTFFVSIGSAVLVCLFLTSHLVGNLYEDPNWFLDRDVTTKTSKFAHTNDQLSEQLASVAEAAAEKTGTYSSRGRVYQVTP